MTDHTNLSEQNVKALSEQSATQEESQPATVSKTRVVAVANQKGGVGKTTTVINLAACLAYLHKKILIIDLDPQANATSGVGMPLQKDTSLYRALLGETSIVTLIQNTPYQDLDIIPSEVYVARQDNYLHCFNTALVPLLSTDYYDIIIVDCPPSLGILTMNALTAAHSILIPIQCEYYALEGLSVIARLVQQLRDSGANPALDIEGIVMTMFDGRTNLSDQVVDEVRKHFETRVYATVIPRNVRLSEAPSFGKPVIHYDWHSTGAKAYMLFAQEFAARIDAVTGRNNR